MRIITIIRIYLQTNSFPTKKKRRPRKKNDIRYCLFYRENGEEKKEIKYNESTEM